jgi:FtsZ-interacting cell division protein ZipA
MKWLIVIAVIAVLLALEWWSSRKPQDKSSHRRGMTKTEQEAHQVHGFRNASNNTATVTVSAACSRQPHCSGQPKHYRIRRSRWCIEG